MKIAPVTRLGAVAATLVAPVLLAGCGTDASAGSGPRVVTSFYALQYVAERVAGDHGRVVNLTEPGQEPHDTELSVPQTAQVAESDLVVYLRGFQGAVDDAVDTTDPAQTLDVAEVADLVAPGESDQEHHGAEESHGHDEVDPHFWLDPHRLDSVAGDIAQRLQDIDPENAEAYRDNYADLESDLTKLDSDFRSGLQACAISTIVVSHDAFGYLGRRYGLEVHAINGLSPDAEPSAAHMRELHQLIERDGITTVFNEELASAQMADTLADDLGLRTAVLDPVEGLASHNADADYLSLMYNNLEALRKANRCT